MYDFANAVVLVDAQAASCAVGRATSSARKGPSEPGVSRRRVTHRHDASAEGHVGPLSETSRGSTIGCRRQHGNAPPGRIQSAACKKVSRVALNVANGVLASAVGGRIVSRSRAAVGPLAREPGLEFLGEELTPFIGMYPKTTAATGWPRGRPQLAPLGA